MEYFKKILRYALPYKYYGALNIFFNILYAIFSGLSFVVLMPLLQVLFRANEKVGTIKAPVYDGIISLGTFFKESLSYHTTLLVREDKVKALTMVVILIISVFLLKNVFGYLANYFITFLRNGVLKDLRNDLYKKTITLPVSFFSEKRKGDIMARIGTDVLEVQHSFLSILELIFRDPLMILFTIGFMLMISVKLTLFVFIFVPIAGFFINILGRNLKKDSDEVQYEQGHFLSILDETLGGLRVIKAFNAEKLFQNKFKNSTSRFERLLNKLLNRINLASPVSEVLGISVFAVLLWYGGSLVLVDQTLRGEDFIAYLGLAYNILTPAKSISKASYTVKKGNAAAERILHVLETKNELEDKPNAITKKEFTNEIAFNNISFKYEEENVLSNFSLTIPKGKTVALVGQSGSGKSTLANLITRFYDVNKGSITIDGTDIRDITKQSLMDLMGLVSQDSILFNDTVANNIKLGNPKATDEQVKSAALVANADEFIQNIPKQYEANIGDGGNKLSGGQKQRLSIARAVLKNPPIMVLDEATSALDTESEKLVQSALDKMTENRTSLVIAHRLSTVQRADVIVVLRKGKIVEQGKHEELMEHKGEYFKLVTMQSL